MTSTAASFTTSFTFDAIEPHAEQRPHGMDSAMYDAIVSSIITNRAMGTTGARAEGDGWSMSATRFRQVRSLYRVEVTMEAAPQEEGPDANAGTEYAERHPLVRREPDHFDISGMAGDVVDWIDTGDASRALTALRLWMTLTGLAEEPALEYARTVASAERPTYAFPPAL